MQKTLSVFGVVCVLLAWSAAPAHAQLCTGAARFANAPLQVGAGVGFSSHARTFGGGVAGGSDALFVGMSVSGQTIDNTSGTGAVIAGHVGSDRSLSRDHRAHVCPLGGIFYAHGPKVATLDTSALGFSAGGAIGIQAATTPAVGVVPTLGLAAVHQRVSVSAGSISVNDSQTYGLAALGVGFIFHEQLALVPSVSRPFGLDGGGTEFFIGLSYNFRMH